MHVCYFSKGFDSVGRSGKRKTKWQSAGREKGGGGRRNGNILIEYYGSNGTLILSGEQMCMHLSRRMWRRDISSPETGVGSARRRVADSIAFATAVPCMAAIFLLRRLMLSWISMM